MRNLFLTFCVAAAVPALSCADSKSGDDNLKTVFSRAGLSLFKEKRKAPAWSLKSLDGRTLSLADLKGKVVFLNFWATWCPPCRAEMPSMEALHKRFADEGLEMIACDIMENQSDVKKFISDNKLSFTTLLDSEGKTGNLYGVQGIPATFIIDREGYIILSAVGGRNWNTAAVHEAFEALLKSSF